MENETGNRSLLERQTIAQEKTYRATLLLSSALAIVAALQTYTSWRSTQLSYALATPKFEITATYASPKDHGLHLNSAGDSIHLNGVSGVYSINSAEIYQTATISYINGGEYHSCDILVSGAYSIRNSFQDYSFTEGGAMLFASKYFDKMDHPGVTITQSATLIDISYIDIFRQYRHQLLSWYPGTSAPLTSLKEFGDDAPTIEVGVDNTDRLSLKWAADQHPSPQCEQLRVAIMKIAPPRISGWSTSSSTKVTRINPTAKRMVTTTTKTPVYSYRVD